jgi:solute:Na+ symporter, SSS family
MAAYLGAGLDNLDLGLVALYLVGITLFGLRFRSKERSLKNYFLADRNIPWWAISLSIVAAETSTLTIISIPGLAYDTNFTFLQLVLGYLVARVIICLIFIPQYFRGDLYTAYQLIDRRFGPRLHKFTAGLFLLTRAAAEGVRVWAVAIVIGIALQSFMLGMSNDARDIASVAIITALTLIYTFEGGMSAVIWTDVVQMLIYIGGTVVGFFTIVHLVPGGWPHIQEVVSQTGKFRMFDFDFSLAKSYTFWAGVIGGAFLTTSTHGTDQLLVQRLLAARNERQSKIALLSSGVFILVQFALFLLVGVSLYVFYQIVPAVPAFAKGQSDRIFPTFIVTHMPHGISGLLIAAILAAAMSNLSAALNSLSSTTVIDFYSRLRPDIGERQRVTVSRAATIFWGLVLFTLALLSRHGGRVLEIGLTIISVAYGALLGVFLLGVLTRKATEIGAIIGMICGLTLNIYLWLGAKSVAQWLGTSIAFTWLVAIGTIVTFAIGYAVSLITAPARELEQSHHA